MLYPFSQLLKIVAIEGNEQRFYELAFKNKVHHRSLTNQNLSF